MSSFATKFRKDKDFFVQGPQAVRTPDELFEQMDLEFHFTLDACAKTENTKVAKYFTEIDDGLTKD